MRKETIPIYRYVPFVIIRVRKLHVKVKKQYQMPQGTGMSAKFVTANSIRKVINGMMEHVLSAAQPAAMKAGGMESATTVGKRAAMKIVTE